MINHLIVEIESYLRTITDAMRNYHGAYIFWTYVLFTVQNDSSWSNFIGMFVQLFTPLTRPINLMPLKRYRTDANNENTSFATFASGRGSHMNRKICKKMKNLQWRKMVWIPFGATTRNSLCRKIISKSTEILR